MPIRWSRPATRRRVGLAKPAERPRQYRLAERQRVAGHAAVRGVPGVPGLAVAVHLAAHQFLLRHLRQARRHQLAGEDLAVVRMPVLFLGLRKGREQPLGDDVLDAGEIGLRSVAVEQRALGEVFVDLPAEVMRLGLVTGIVPYRMKADKINVERIRRRVALQRHGARLQHRGSRGLRLAGWLRGGPRLARSSAGRENHRQQQHRHRFRSKDETLPAFSSRDRPHLWVLFTRGRYRGSSADVAQKKIGTGKGHRDRDMKVTGMSVLES